LGPRAPRRPSSQLDRANTVACPAHPACAAPGPAHDLPRPPAPRPSFAPRQSRASPARVRRAAQPRRPARTRPRLARGAPSAPAAAAAQRAHAPGRTVHLPKRLWAVFSPTTPPKPPRSRTSPSSSPRLRSPPRHRRRRSRAPPGAPPPSPNSRAQRLAVLHRGELAPLPLSPSSPALCRRRSSVSVGEKSPSLSSPAFFPVATVAPCSWPGATGVRMGAATCVPRWPAGSPPSPCSLDQSCAARARRPAGQFATRRWSVRRGREVPGRDLRCSAPSPTARPPMLAPGCRQQGARDKPKPARARRTPNTPPWLAKVAELPSPTPPMSLQPAPAVRLPSPCLGLAVSRVAHVKLRVCSASPCSRSRVVQLVRALAFACAQYVDGTSSTLVYPLVYPPCAFASLATARASRIKSSRVVRARCAYHSHVSSCASVHVNNSPHTE
jgi:hypothetical protein